MNKKQWNKPSVSNLSLEKTMSGTCPLKAKHVVGDATCQNLCSVCGGCKAYGDVYTDCFYNVNSDEYGKISRCTCLAIS